jgi:hypothetical protein
LATSTASGTGVQALALIHWEATREPPPCSSAALTLGRAAVPGQVNRFQVACGLVWSVHGDTELGCLYLGSALFNLHVVHNVEMRRIHEGCDALCVAYNVVRWNDRGTSNMFPTDRGNRRRGYARNVCTSDRDSMQVHGTDGEPRGTKPAFDLDTGHATFLSAFLPHALALALAASAPWTTSQRSTRPSSGATPSMKSQRSSPLCPQTTRISLFMSSVSLPLPLHPGTLCARGLATRVFACRRRPCVDICHVGDRAGRLRMQFYRSIEATCADSLCPSHQQEDGSTVSTRERVIKDVQAPATHPPTDEQFFS